MSKPNSKPTEQEKDVIWRSFAVKIVAMLLVDKENIGVHDVSSQGSTYDLEVPFPDGKIFHKPAAIKIVTTQGRFKTIARALDVNIFYEFQSFCEKQGYESWIAYVPVSLSHDGKIAFENYLVPSEIIEYERVVEKIAKMAKRKNSRIHVYTSARLTRACAAHEIGGQNDA